MATICSRSRPIPPRSISNRSTSTRETRATASPASESLSPTRMAWRTSLHQRRVRRADRVRWGRLATGLYDLPASGDTLESVVFLQCQPLIPGSAVLVITGFLDPAQLDAQFADVNAVIDSIELGASIQPTFDESDLEQVVQSSTVDIDSFWDGAFGDWPDRGVIPSSSPSARTSRPGAATPCRKTRVRSIARAIRRSISISRK